MEFIENEQRKEEIPIILMGDFNATPNSKVIKELSNSRVHNKRLVAVQDFNKELYSKATMGNFKVKETGIHINEFQI